MAAILLLCAAGPKAATPVIPAPSTPAPPSINAGSYVLIDFNSGEVLAENGARTRMEPASLTKLMTAYIVFNELQNGRLRYDQPVTISENAWRTQGSRMFVDVNTQVKVEDLLKGMIVQSGNDATVALAEQVAGSEDAFAGLMNNAASALQMKDSHFGNSSGMPDPEHYTTAYDLALLTRALIASFPEDYRLYSLRDFTYNNITQHNRNRMLWRDASVDGVKTGHTDSAGYCLITSALRDDMRLISVVLRTKSDDSRVEETQKLINYGFRFYESHRLYAAGSSLTTTRVWKGVTEELPLGLAQDLHVTIPRNQYQKLNAAMNMAPTITAPVHKGQQLGTIQVTLDGKNIAERPLVALSDVPEGSFAQRITDEIRLFFE
ncbi:MAG: D-alanyl-D-alanine carboxypeptidase [Gammaproteobacteria bacterium]|nr:D-alanyl-D-alanine carboxypeptidase [Gammaproteobacteria bacterium]